MPGFIYDLEYSHKQDIDRISYWNLGRHSNIIVMCLEQNRITMEPNPLVTVMKNLTCLFPLTNCFWSIYNLADFINKQFFLEDSKSLNYYLVCLLCKYIDFSIYESVSPRGVFSHGCVLATAKPWDTKYVTVSRLVPLTSFSKATASSETLPHSIGISYGRFFTLLLCTNL